MKLLKEEQDNIWLKILEIPIRNWNKDDLEKKYNPMKDIRNTYKELKQGVFVGEKPTDVSY